MTLKKWDDPQLDAAQFAIDRFLNAKQNVSEQMATIYQSIQDGSATDEDRKRLKGLREQYIALSKEVEDVMGDCWSENNCFTRNWSDEAKRK
jgi:hypothetical protein